LAGFETGFLGATVTADLVTFDQSPQSTTELVLTLDERLMFPVLPAPLLH
jgi:hypothetical protein